MAIGLVLAGDLGDNNLLLNCFHKVMIPIGKMKKPLLEYPIRLMKHYELNDIIISIKSNADQIINYFGDGSRFGVNISYVFDPPETIGAGNGAALYNAIKKMNQRESMIVYYGDIITNINLKKLLEFHKQRGALITVGLSDKFAVNVGVAEIEEQGKIKRFREKPTLDWLVNIGVFVIEPTINDTLEKLLESKKIVDISRDLIPVIIKKYGNVYGYVTSVWWYDIGSVDKLNELRSEDIDKKMNFLFEDPSEKKPKIY